MLMPSIFNDNLFDDFFDLPFYDDKTEQKNVEELRAYGQHFGLPTNYLDFTEAH